MNKTRIYLLVVISILFLVGLISLNKGKAGIPQIDAYSGACDPPYTNMVVNAMDDTVTASCGTSGSSGPSTDSYNDITAWQPKGILFAPPVVDATGIFEGGSPTAAALGANFMRVQWLSNKQSLILPSAMFENSSGNNWSAYEYVGFDIYLNWQLNFSTILQIPQTISFTDGNGFTVTSTAADCRTNLDGLKLPYIWHQHVTVSLNWLANQKDPNSINYFQVNNIQTITINAPDVDYLSLSGNPLYAYYDDLSLGAGLTTYGSPPTGPADVTIQTVNSPPVHGAYVRWNPFPPGSIINALTPTAYEVYRSLVMGNGSPGPYVPVCCPSGAIVPYDLYLPQCITDTSCPGGGVFCYKILTCDYGPDASTYTAMGNTVNATYHQDLLANVPEVCGWVDLVPSPIPTPTSTIVCPVGGCPTPMGTNTITPTATPTPLPTSTPDITNAHIYPNPFNPNDGSKTFYVNNVLIGTKVYIYSMDGSLVVEGALTNGNAHYQIVGGFPTFVWDGKNRNGTRVVSGLYYLVLEDPNKKTRVLRIIVCYKCKPVYGEP